MSALAPYRVLDLTSRRGWLCGKLLGGLGADVVKVDLAIADPEQRDEPDHPDWRAGNMSKRLLGLDLGHAADRNELRRLVAAADIVIESAVPRALEPLGLIWDDLHRKHPRTILTSITPFGQNGPRAHERAGELELWASAGILYLTGEPDRPPVTVSVPEAYAQAGAEAAVGTLVALARRGQTGIGRHVDVSVQQALADLVLLAVPQRTVAGALPRRTGWAWRGARVVHRLCYPCADGFVTLGIMGGGAPAYVASSRHVVEWMLAEGAAPPWLVQLDWATDYDASALEQDLVDRVEAAIGAFLEGKTKQTIYRAAIERGFLAAPVNTVADILDSEQLGARDYWVRDALDGTGPLACGAAVKASATPMRVRPVAGTAVAELATWTEQAPDVRGMPAANGALAERPLEGIRVLELATAIAGPMVGRRLAAWGAEVVRVESHRHPDTVRSGGPFAGGVPGIDRSVVFADVNAGKRSVALDIGHAAAPPVVERMLRWADVVITGFRPGVAEALGLGYESARAARPDVVYLQTSLQGSTGPCAAVSGFGNQAGALAGVSELTGWPDREPSQPFGAVTDFFSPRVACAVVLAALDHRRRTGEGQLLDQSQLETAGLLLGGAILDFQLTGKAATRRGNRSDRACPHGVFPVQGDDRWCAISVWDDAEWSRLAELASGTGWVPPHRWSTSAARREHEDELERGLAEWTKGWQGPELHTALQASGVSSALVADVDDVLADVQLRHRRYFTVREHPVIGDHVYSGQGFVLSGNEPRLAPGPCLGADTSSFLIHDLGMSAEEVDGLRAAGAITTESGAYRQSF